jgi:ABC-2 type transport system permease protein
MHDLRRVIAFTVRNKVRTKSYVVTTVVMALIISIVVNLPFIFSLFQTDKADHFGMIRDADGIAEQLRAVLASGETGDAVLHVYDDQGSADANESFLRDKMREGEIIGYLIVTGQDAAGFPTLQYKSEDTLDYEEMGKLQNGLQMLKFGKVSASLGLSEEQLALLNSPVEINKVQISLSENGDVGGKSEMEIVIATFLVYILIILLFVAIMVSGQMIASEITMEKSSRIMEILITSVKPLAQMFGKIIGMCIVGLSQLLVLFGAGIANLVLPHNREAFANLDIDLSLIDPRLIVYAIIFYLSGYLLYATLFAAVGSIVSRTEDLGQAVMPISIISMIGYFVAIFGIQDPAGPLVVITSYIPFFSPFIMFLRMGVTDPALWEVWLSIGILLATIVLCGWLSAKIYRTGVLMYGKRPTIRELRKAMKAYKI